MSSQASWARFICRCVQVSPCNEFACTGQLTLFVGFYACGFGNLPSCLCGETLAFGGSPLLTFLFLSLFRFAMRGLFGRQKLTCLAFGRRGPDRLPDADRRAQQEDAGQHRSGRQHGPIPPGELAEAIRGRWRTGVDRLVVQVALQVHRQPVGRLVPPIAVLLQRLHHDPVELAAHDAR